MRSGSSYVDYLEPGETLGLGVKDVCVQLEKEGWSVTTRTGRGFRFWCPESKCGKHQIWLDTESLVQERLEFFLRKTCFTFN